MRVPLFRIWYSTTYTTLFIILVILLAISPGDTIYQSIKIRAFQKLFIVGGVYVLTFFIVLLVYSTRLYTNRTVLQAIPKGYVPLEEGELGKGIRRMVTKQLRRSAIIAWDCRPRDTRGEVGIEEEEEELGDGGPERIHSAESRKEKERRKIQPPKKKGHHHVPNAIFIPLSPKSPPWGHISHPGWASPASPDLPNLKYSNVICELPNLIEAKAVSLAPPDPAVDNTQQYPDNAPPLPDAQIVALLQRPRAMGLREYLGRLAELGLLNPPSLGPTFLTKYEYARFSTSCLTEHEFRDIMAVFADILNGMQTIDPMAIEEARAQSIMSDTRSLAPTESSTESAHSNNSSILRPNRPFLTPQPDRPRSSASSSYTDTESLRSEEDGPQYSPQATRLASLQRHQRPAFAPHPSPPPRTPSERSLHSASETGSVMIHSRQRESPENFLGNSSPSSLSSSLSLRSAQSVIRLRSSHSEGELPYEYPHLDQG